MSWEEVALKNTCTFIDGDRGKNYPSNGELLDAGDCLFLSTGNVTSSGFNFESCQFITREKDELLKNGRIQEGDVVITTRGTLGNVAVFTKAVPYKKIRINSGMLILRPLEIVDSIFLYYAICNPVFKSKINAVKTGSAQPQIPAKTLKQLKIPLPPLETQERIVSILSAYDTLIENNRRQIKLLEETAQRLYKEWFVDLKFPGRESTPIVNGLPEGWKETSIGGSFTTVLGGTPSRENLNYWNGDIPWINSGEINSLRIIKESEFITELGLNNSSAKLMPCHTTVLAITGATLGQVSYTEIETCANQSVIGIIDKSGFYSIYIYLFISTEIRKMIGKATGGAQQHINKNIVNAYQIILPEDGIVKKLNDLIQPLFNKIAILSKQNLEIKEARDRLLPKLMSGEIEV